MWYVTPHEMDTQAPNQIAAIVGANIHFARQARGLTQRQVAEGVGVTNRDVSRWENGRVEPGPFYRQALADFLFDGDISAMYRETPEAA